MATKIRFKLSKLEALKKVERWFELNVWRGAKCTIYAWDGRVVRISEVSIFKSSGSGGTGLSWMSTDPDGLAVIACAERWVINLMSGDEDAQLYEDIMRYLMREGKR